MKLLFDNNLSPRLITRLADVFPDATHVGRLGMQRASDEDVWAFAAANGFTIVSKDADFDEFVVLRGFPPKVVWLRLGNCSTADVEAALRAHRVAIEALVADEETGILVVTRPAVDDR